MLTPLSEETLLEQMLAARDKRVARHAALADRYPNATVIGLTMVAPGPFKRTLQSLSAAHAACSAILARFGRNIISAEQWDLHTGFEADFVVDMSPQDAKRIAIDIEDRHPLGRLFDIDIIGEAGLPISRLELRMPPRKCLVCVEPARFCMRAGNHSRDEVYAKISDIVDNYFSSIT